MARLAYTATLLAALLAFTAATPASRRLLGKDEGEQEVSTTVEEGTTTVWVADTAKTWRLPTDLAPIFLALQADEDLRAGALQCAEATGIAAIASDLPKMLLKAVEDFKVYGYCAMPTLDEQAGMLSGMLGQAISIHMRDMLLDEYSCEGVTALPEECFFAALVEAPLQAAVEAKDGALLCANVASDGASDRKKVEVLTLPEDWAAAAPVYQCQARE